MLTQGTLCSERSFDRRINVQHEPRMWIVRREGIAELLFTLPPIVLQPGKPFSSFALISE
jgi:hypothetical protein